MRTRACYAREHELPKSATAMVPTPTTCPKNDQTAGDPEEDDSSEIDGRSGDAESDNDGAGEAGVGEEEEVGSEKEAADDEEGEEEFRHFEE